MHVHTHVYTQEMLDYLSFYEQLSSRPTVAHKRELKRTLTESELPVWIKHVSLSAGMLRPRGSPAASEPKDSMHSKDSGRTSIQRAFDERPVPAVAADPWTAVPAYTDPPLLSAVDHYSASPAAMPSPPSSSWRSRIRGTDPVTSGQHFFFLSSTFCAMICLSKQFWHRVDGYKRTGHPPRGARPMDGEAQALVSDLRRRGPTGRSERDMGPSKWCAWARPEFQKPVAAAAPAAAAAVAGVPRADWHGVSLSASIMGAEAATADAARGGLRGTGDADAQSFGPRAAAAMATDAAGVLGAIVVELQEVASLERQSAALAATLQQAWAAMHGICSYGL